MTRSVGRNTSVLAVAAALIVSLGAAAPGAAAPARERAAPGGPPVKTPVAVGYGGAVASVDADASAAGIEVLRRGGNAVDAAVATAAALGVTEPYSSGIGGGGYFVHYEAATGKVRTIDGRETAPRSADASLFLADGKPIPFEEGQTSGLGVGVPGTPATWDAALASWGTRPLAELLGPAERLARDGFTVDGTFRAQTQANQARFADFPDTAKLFLPGGGLPVVGSVFKNPDLARTYRRLAREGTRALYRGDIARDIVRTVRTPPVAPGATRTVRPGDLTLRDLRAYETVRRTPTRVSYRGLDVYGMAPSSSGGIAVGEGLNILERTDLSKATAARHLHRFIEASRVAFADRGRWVGDPAFEDVPVRGLLSQRFADARACLIKDNAVLTSPLAPGDPENPVPCGASGPPVPATYESDNTTHLTVADRWGNVVAYTLTIESTGGSGITVPGRGFLLNNELTDFSFAPANPAVHDPNLPGPGKRPRSSISPTIVVDDGRVRLALGSPGGATIITTVLQTLTNRLDRGMPLVEAIAAPRASQRNQTTTEVEPALWNSPLRAQLEAIGHRFRQNPEIGAATGVERLPDGRWLAAAEKVRRGGGSAMVVRPGS
ncbi:gamma-glutamyltransferase [Streptomyces clavuligerus]|uniref:Glutathione hydrolase proenzyme n=1 Tax=Streptomyces clavuligerus TaxID=1901 RepID=E2PX29_STRCL|nr:gamma-glutamyltransferase [Streptomyces clavuligerus]ANW17411.1 gamma-glutamyltransferase [Streptomyces clavuligerus]AXU11961.1 gamma-glutamyltransferase [Streptomyces clavuligerus]EFG10106.1 Putative gamma-glutamyltranspeptidase [Streptomyces clavuligerus]MBY6301805.1 gamma-glutamyltransferase [Streptomyces clavuligerus]QCS04740.1 gamma-glutamyltransferase [Streptomyces clavuligerus]